MNVSDLLRHALLLVLITSCGMLKFDGAHSGASQDSGSDVTASVDPVASKNDDVATSAPDAGIDQPVMASGSFLTCAYDPTLKAGDGQLGIGCAIMKDGVKLNIATPLKATSDVRNALGTVLNLPILDVLIQPQDRWHWHYFPTFDQLQDAFVHAQLTNAKTNETFPMKFDLSKVDIHPEEKTEGAPLGFSFGNGSGLPKYNEDCPDTISNSPNLLGKSADFSFQAETRENLVNVVMEGICGISQTDLGYNSVALMEGTTVLKKIDLKMGEKKAVFENIRVKKGTVYKLHVQSYQLQTGPNTGDYDDFFVEKIIFKSQDPLKIEY